MCRLGRSFIQEESLAHHSSSNVGTKQWPNTEQSQADANTAHIAYASTCLTEPTLPNVDQCTCRSNRKPLITYN